MDRYLGISYALLKSSTPKVVPAVPLAPALYCDSVLWKFGEKLESKCERICEKGPNPAKPTFAVRPFVASHVELGPLSDFLTNT